MNLHMKLNKKHFLFKHNLRISFNHLSICLMVNLPTIMSTVIPSELCNIRKLLSQIAN